MGISRLWGAKPNLQTNQIMDAKTRAAAEVIDENFGKKGNREISSSDLRDAKAALEKHQKAIQSNGTSPLQDLRSKEINVLAEQLPKLEKLLGTSEGKKQRAAFATSIKTYGIRNPQVQQAGEAISSIFGQTANTINLKELKQAKEALLSLQDGSLEKTNPALAQKLQNAPALTMENLEELELFMETGKGGLLSHGPFSVNGKTFSDVYKLPPVSTYGASAANFRSVSDMKSAVQVYEKQFEDIGYDRVYIQGDDGNLYLALAANDSVDDIKGGYRAQSYDTNGEVSFGGTVLTAVDENNSLRDATIDFWKEKLSLVFNMIRGKMDRKLDSDLSRIADYTFDPLGRVDENPPAEYKEKLEELKTIKDLRLAPMPETTASTAPENTEKVSNLKRLLAAGGSVASLASFVGLSSFNPMVGGTLAAATVGGATIFKVADYLLNDENKAPIFHALGVAVNQSADVVY